MEAVRSSANGGGGADFAYDAEGQLRIADGLSVFRDIRYDPLGRLRQVGTGPVLVHAGARLMAEYAGSTMTRRHVFGPGLDEPLVTYAGSAKSWHVADERGSVVAATNASGAATATHGYGPHGEPDARGLPQRFGYTGALVMDGIGLTQMRARAYSHRLGRFLQTDPIGQAGGINVYDYVGGDAVNRRDPEGTNPLIGCGIGVIGSLAGDGLDAGLNGSSKTFGGVFSRAAGACIGGILLPVRIIRTVISISRAGAAISVAGVGGAAGSRLDGGGGRSGSGTKGGTKCYSTGSRIPHACTDPY